MIELSLSKTRILKTAALYFSAIASGMSFAVTGPTLLDLQRIVNTDTEHIAFIYTARSNGYMFGSLAGGVLFDLMSRKQMVMTLLSLVMTLSVFAIPWSTTVPTLTGLMVLNGACIGAVDTGLNVCVLHLWGKDSGPFYQALHFVYGFGGLVSPLIAAQFLSPEILHRHNDETTTVYNGTDFTTTSSFPAPELFISSSVQYLNVTKTEPTFTSEYLNAITSTSEYFLNATTMSTYLNVTTAVPFWNALPPVTVTYAIISCVALLVTCCFFFLCVVSPFDDTCQKKDDEPTRKRSTTFVFVVVFINFFLLFFETGTEIGYAQMLTTYAVKGPLHLTKTRGSYMTSCFWGTFTLSRFASIFLAIRLSSFTLLAVDLVITTAGALVLLTVGGSHEWCLWLATVLLGVGIASFWPAAVAWVEGYIDVNNRIVSLFTVGAAFGEMFIPWLISRFIEEEPGVLGYVAVSSCVLSGGLTVIMYLFLRGQQTKYLTEEEKKQVAENPIEKCSVELKCQDTAQSSPKRKVNEAV